MQAQQVNVKEDFYDAEFFLAEEEYEEALYSFQKVYNAGFQENANINYRIGICNINIPGQKEKAIPFLEKAVLSVSENNKEGNFNETLAPLDAWLYLGNAYRIANQLDKSIESYEAYLKSSANLTPTDIEYAKQQIESCNRAKEAINNPVSIYKENLGKSYNSNLNNYQVVYSGDGNSMAYMSAQKFYDAINFVKKINGNWSNPINITPQVESDGNQYVSSLSYDGLKLFLVQINNFDGDIMVSDYSMGRWNPSKSIGKPINTKFFESHASISPDGKTLYFTSNRTEGIGGMDIYTTTLSDKGVWSDPVNIGNVVNTPLNEETPFICNDGKTLYFSSQGHSTIGGYDVFVTVLQNNNTWSEPKPLAYPINTADDELFFFPDPQNKGGYLTLYDPKGFGDGDLYYIKEISQEEALADAQNVIKPVVTEPLVNEPVVAKPVVAELVVVKPAEPQTVAEDVNKPKAQPNKYFAKPIFFGFDSYALTDASKEKLHDLISALKEYPLLSIEVRGYTDALGSNEYNQVLSEKRAKAVTSFLISNGIDANRVKNKGFGESENIALNTYQDGRDALEGRKFNRRVEFRIAQAGGALLIIEEISVPEQLRVK